jgi:hypothetical protein
MGLLYAAFFVFDSAMTAYSLDRGSDGWAAFFALMALWMLVMAAGERR